MNRLTSSTAYVNEIAAHLSRWPDNAQLRGAAEAHAARCPAYLDKACGMSSNDALSQLVGYANTHGGLGGAIKALARDYPAGHHDSVDLLDFLVPLNERAVDDLDSEYELHGTFRGRGELRSRNPLMDDMYVVALGGMRAHRASLKAVS